MWRYTDTGEPFDETILIPPITKQYYTNLDTYLSLYDEEKEPPKKTSYFCCFSFNT